MNGITKQDWGVTQSGEPVELYTLRNAHGIEAQITTFGGRLVSLHTPDRKGTLEDIVLGFDNLEGYLQKNPYFGALVGRYANRIADGAFKLDGTAYTLARNDGSNSLHGGTKGFDKVVWKATEHPSANDAALELSYLSVDGEDGYPGNLSVTVRYALSEKDELRLDYRATTDKDTVLNLTNHSYFNLSGQTGGKILDYRVTINGSRYTPVNANLIPTGELCPVAGTPFDFTKAARIGDRIDDPDRQLQYALGYDHNFVLNGTAGQLALAAKVKDPATGRVLEVFTTQPGIQFYTGNHLDGTVKGKRGTPYAFRHAVCFETQHFPDSPNHPQFPSTELKPGEQFQCTTVFRFSAE